ncbi:MAG TPA: hypothetical protein VMK12_19415 [Anaeromyxobacteraceae bacterium]|nr:hypothetical protein [Anaeromyxobacteraceae bacterium]
MAPPQHPFALVVLAFEAAARGAVDGLGHVGLRLRHAPGDPTLSPEAIRDVLPSNDERLPVIGGAQPLQALL